MKEQKLRRMSKVAATIACFLILGTTHAQRVEHIAGKQMSPAEYDNIHVAALDDHPLSSTFMIWVKEGVKEHYHEHHTEVVYVLEGEGRMKLNEDWRMVKAGDYIFIPKGTRHAVEVISDEPMKVISIQSPRFDGTDRVFVSQK
jgi:quercetin dioxygenase-like cupin family protein